MLDRFAREQASRQVGEYYYPTPSERALGKNEEAFNRAKNEVLSYMKKNIENVEALSYDEFAPELKSGRVMKAVAAIDPFWRKPNTNGEAV